MRTDSDLADGAVRESKKWKNDEIGGEGSSGIDSRLQAGDEIINGKLVVHSLSGNERNRLFLNENAGEHFSDHSALAGLDSDSDSRGFALLDYDRDGWQDIALVNANNPLSQLFHNELGKFSANKGGMIAIRFRGGSTSDTPSDLSNRDGYGAIVEATLADGTLLKREHRCGDGYASQNSATMIIGIGDHASVSKVTVRWPSGKSFTCENVSEGTLLTAYEKREDGAFTREPYRSTRKSAAPLARPKYQLPFAKPTPGKIQVYTTTATWCAACIGHLPSLKYLQTDDIALFGVPTDPNDTPAMLKEYVAEKNPPYQMLTELGSAEKERLSSFLAKNMRTENPVLPSTIITDEEGNVLEIMKGIPNLSQVRRWKYERK